MGVTMAGRSGLKRVLLMVVMKVVKMELLKAAR